MRFKLFLVTYTLQRFKSDNQLNVGVNILNYPETVDSDKETCMLKNVDNKAVLALIDFQLIFVSCFVFHRSK